MSNGDNTGTGRRPLKEFRVGGVSASIWEKEQDSNNRSNPLYSVKINRTYKDKNSNEFKNTDYYFPNDLPKVMLAANKAFEYISLREDKSVPF